MRSLVKLSAFVLLVIVLSACGGVAGQHKAINTARVSVEGTAIGADAADLAVHETYGVKPADDEDSYCKTKIAALVFAQTRITLNGALDVILVWERSLTAYEAKKGAGSETDDDWSDVLSSEADWLNIAADVIGVLEGVRLTLKLWDVKIPGAVDHAWGLISGFTGKAVKVFKFDFGDLKGSVCFDKIPDEFKGGE